MVANQIFWLGWSNNYCSLMSVRIMESNKTRLFWWDMVNAMYFKVYYDEFELTYSSFHDHVSSEVSETSRHYPENLALKHYMHDIQGLNKISAICLFTILED